MAKRAKAVPVLIETPIGNRSKLSFDYERCLLKLTKVLPAGFDFPFNFGSIPCTRADDGDPLDILLLMDERVPPGSLVAARPIGVMEAEQGKKGKLERNDRIVGVAVESREHAALATVKDMPSDLRREYERFFEAYNAQSGKIFRSLGWFGPKRAWRLIDRGRRRCRPLKLARLPRTYGEFAEAAADH